MKLLWITPDPPLAVTGFGKVSFNLLKRLPDDWEIDVLSYSPVPLLRRKIGNIQISYFSTYGGIRDLMRQYKPDKMIVYSSFMFFVDYAKNRYFYPHCPEEILYYPIELYPLYPDIDKYVSEYDKVIVPSNHSKKILKKYNIESSVVYHGVDLDVFKYMPEYREKNMFVVGSVSRNDIRKQMNRLLYAWKTIEKSCPSAYLHMVTNPKAIQHKLIAGFDLDLYVRLYQLKRASFHTYSTFGLAIPEDALARLYNSWDIHVLTTGSESFGIPYVESMACGLPNITIDHGSAKEVLGDAGVYIPYKEFSPLVWGDVPLIDIEKLATWIMEFYERKDLIDEYANRSLEQVKKFTWERGTKQFMDVLEK